MSARLILNTHRADRFVMHAFLPPQIAGTEPKARQCRLCLRRFRPPYDVRVCGLRIGDPFMSSHLECEARL